MNERKKIKAADFFILALSVAAIALAFYKLPKKSQQGKTLVIRSEAGEEVHSLETDATYRIEGPLGTSVIRVEEEKVFFEESPCPNKNCVLSGALELSGDWAACLPNRVFISIEGKEKNQTDAVSG